MKTSTTTENILFPSSIVPAAKPKAYVYVRFSRAEQMAGDSLARQRDSSDAYIKAHGLEISDAPIQDLGVSAFRGKNASVGELGKFLTLVEKGDVKRGSYLLVESLDRLSRRDLENAYEQFSAITKAGIVIVTLSDGQRYERGKIDLGKLIGALAVMQRAHEESAMKSMRLSAAWERKRANLGSKKQTSLCPGWLKINPEKTAFDPIPERAKIVKRIFSETIKGKGRRTIANELNTARIEPWGLGRKKGEGWQDSYISKILFSSAVIGQYQPHKMIEGRRVPVGEVVEDYFPAVVTKTTFYAAQAALGPRSQNKGRRPLTAANLFAGLCFCGSCGGKVLFVDKGKEQWRYLRCNRTARKLSNCTPFSYPYGDFEEMFWSWLVDFDFSESQSGARSQKELELDALIGQKRVAEKQLGRVTEALTESDSPVRAFVEKARSLNAQIEYLEGAAEILRSEIASIGETGTKFDFAVEIEKPNSRFRLREELRKRVKRITFFFGGEVGHKNFKFDNSFQRVELSNGDVLDMSGSGGEVTVAFGERVERWIGSPNGR